MKSQVFVSLNRACGEVEVSFTGMAMIMKRNKFEWGNKRQRVQFWIHYCGGSLLDIKCKDID